MRSRKLGSSCFCLTGYVPWSLLETRTTEYLMFRLGAPKSHISSSQEVRFLPPYPPETHQWIRFSPDHMYVISFSRSLSLSIFYLQFFLNLGLFLFLPLTVGSIIRFACFGLFLFFSTRGLTANIRIQKKKASISSSSSVWNGEF